MATCVQTLPAQTNSTALLSGRPSSASGLLQSSGSSSMTFQPYGGQTYARNAQSNSYRGQQLSSAPIAPYAFTSTPNLNSRPNNGRPVLAPVVIDGCNRGTLSAPTSPGFFGRAAEEVLRVPSHVQAASVSPTSSVSSGCNSNPAISTPASSPVAQNGADRPTLRPLSTMSLSSLMSPANTPATITTPTRPQPDRYRRSHRRSEVLSFHSTAVPTGPSQPSQNFYAQPERANSSPILPTPNVINNMPPVPNQVPIRPGLMDYTSHNLRASSYDDMHTGYANAGMDLVGRRPRQLDENARRRSFAGIESVFGRRASMTNVDQQSRPRLHARSTSLGSAAHGQTSPPNLSQLPQTPVSTYAVQRPSASRRGSADSSTSNKSGRSSVSRPQSRSRDSGAPQSASNVLIPPRSSSDISKRLNAPSPLSRPADVSITKEDDNIKPPFAANIPLPESPVSEKDDFQTRPPTAHPQDRNGAADRLAALSNDPRKGFKSRLRRAFSFGSAAELRKATVERTINNDLAMARAARAEEKRKQAEAEREAKLVREQEESGLGEGIYSGQGKFFMGSTDAISVSSTASSASIIMRKMGKGVRKSTKSLVGLFRPKSVQGVASSSSKPTDPSLAAVSRVNVEAERELVNVNVDPHDHAGGGTGYPKLGRNSLENSGPMVKPVSSHGSETSSSFSRMSIIGGERERAEVLASMKKGILKRSASASPVITPVDGQAPQLLVPSASTAPNTPAGKERNEYFGQRNGSDSLLSSKTTVSFSPRLTFYDTWRSEDYDRRGEIATCNRLTPILAQQIKEELNTFKMEMEVHEESKVHTHFF